MAIAARKHGVDWIEYHQDLKKAGRWHIEPYGWMNDFFGIRDIFTFG